MIWIFNEGEGDGIESRLPFKIFSTLLLRGCETPQPVSFYIVEAAAVALSSKEERAEQRKT